MATVGFSYDRYAASDHIHYKHLLSKGLDERKVRAISALKHEPEWMLDIRLRALRIYNKKTMPDWGADLSGIDFGSLRYYASSIDEKYDKWDKVPKDIKRTFDRIGIPEAERK
ncbi:Fe-S cluster assembly protein SufB, partial [Candidatus Micrarchaeota archaeon]|nr:Fe-S cluster assembly protein SufB [Candidatus Micrarchaeota archaeon]